jgi:hypothetical protein
VASGGGIGYDFDKRLVSGFVSRLHHLDVTDLGSIL